MSDKKINEAGLHIIMTCEGLRLTAYKDIRGIPTIGYGHTSGVQMGTFITEMHAQELLDHDLEHVEHVVNTRVSVPITDNEFSALCSLVYNIGEAAFASSTLLKKINQRDMVGASEEFMRWCYVKRGGVKEIVDGLAARRKAEQTLFNS